MEICKAPTLQLKALNKPSIINTHNVHRDGNVTSNKNVFENLQVFGPWREAITPSVYRWKLNTCRFLVHGVKHYS